MLKVVCMGISTLDIFVAPVSAQTLQIQKTRVREIGLAPGGDAANQAIMLARLGCEPVLISRIGNDESGAYVLNRLQEHGVNISHIVRDDERPTAAAVVLIDTQGERHILSAAGAHAHLCQADVNMQAIRAAQALSICSLFSLPILEDNGLVEILRDAKSHGVLIFADMGTDKRNQKLAGIRPFLPYIDYFVPSEYDAQQLTGQTDHRVICDTLQEAGAKHVLLKLGAKGCYIHDTKEYVPALSVSAVDTTGAGDCFVAAFLYSLLSGSDIRLSARYACTAASLSTLYMGANTAPIDDALVRQHMIMPNGFD